MKNMIGVVLFAMTTAWAQTPPPKEVKKALPNPTPILAPGWSPGQVTGPPNARLGADDSKAWASLTTDSGNEWLEVTFQNPKNIDVIRVVESLNAGALVRIVALTRDGDIEIWSEPAMARRPGFFSVKARRSAFANVVRLELSTDKVGGWNEIDAVEMVGLDGSRQWASAARASSSFGSKAAPIDPLKASIGKRVRIVLSTGRVVRGILETAGEWLTVKNEKSLYIQAIHVVEFQAF